MKSGQTVTSFARYSDVVSADQRLFEVNEGLSEEIVIPLLKRATERVLTKFRATDWWSKFFSSTQFGQNERTLPSLDASKVKGRENDFTDLCIATAMSEYILPRIADFGDDDNAERKKMSYYLQRADSLFSELLTAGDWYDFDGTGAVTESESRKGFYNLKRVR